MKRLFSILAAIGTFTSTFGDLAEAQTDSYNYVKVGSSLLVQNVGIGKRKRDITRKVGRDYSINSNFITAAPLVGSLVAFPSFKYTRLNYAETTPDSRYSGYGFELMLPIVANRSGMGGFMPLPNVELVWGKEESADRFSQFGLNLLPAASFVAGTGLALFGKRTGWIMSDHKAGLGTMAIAGSVMVSYSVGF